MLALFAAAWLVLNPASGQDAAPPPADAHGGWMLLQHFYPGPTLGRGIDYWVSSDDYGAGPNAEGLLRVRVITPNEFGDDLRPRRFIDVVREIDCVKRLERFGEPGASDEWQALPDFVPGARMIFSLCDPDWTSRAVHQPDLAAAIAYSQELERLHRTKGPHPVY